MRLWTAGAFCTVVGLSAGAHAAIINVDFNGIRDDDAAVAPSGPTYVGVGAVGTGTFNNGVLVDSHGTTYGDSINDDNLTITATNLKDDAGVTTGVGFTISGVGGDYNDVAPGGSIGTDALTDDYLFNSGLYGETFATVNNTAPFTISGLTATTADLYFIGNVPTSNIFIDNSYASFSTVTGANGLSYLKFDDVTITGGTINGRVFPTNFGIVYGLTIDVSVPEPASLGLLGLAIPFIARRRR